MTQWEAKASHGEDFATTSLKNIYDQTVSGAYISSSTHLSSDSLLEVEGGSRLIQFATE